jgi:hypothetical protein
LHDWESLLRAHQGDANQQVNLIMLMTCNSWCLMMSSIEETLVENLMPVSLVVRNSTHIDLKSSANLVGGYDSASEDIT